MRLPKSYSPSTRSSHQGSTKTLAKHLESLVLVRLTISWFCAEQSRWLHNLPIRRHLVIAFLEQPQAKTELLIGCKIAKMLTQGLLYLERLYTSSRCFEVNLGEMLQERMYQRILNFPSSSCPNTLCFISAFRVCMKLEEVQSNFKQCVSTMKKTLRKSCHHVVSRDIDSNYILLVTR